MQSRIQQRILLKAGNNFTWEKDLERKWLKINKSCKARGTKANIGTILFNRVASANNTCDNHEVTRCTFWKRKQKSVDIGYWKPSFSTLEWEVTDR